MGDLWAFRTDVTSEGADLPGMAVQALDGGMGTVQEVVDRDSRTFLLVDSGPWIFGKTIKVPAGLVSAINRDDGVVSIDRPKDDLKGAPGQEGELVDDAAHEEALARYYGFDAGDAGVATRTESPDSAPTAPGILSAAAPSAEDGASGIDAGSGNESFASRRDESRSQIGDDGPDRTGAEPPATLERPAGGEAASISTGRTEGAFGADGPQERGPEPARAEDSADASPRIGDDSTDRPGAEPPSTPERAAGVEAASISTGATEGALGADGPQERGAEPARSGDGADASPRPATITPDTSTDDAGPSPTAPPIGTPSPEARREKPEIPTSRRGAEASRERSRTASRPERTRAKASSTAEAPAPAPKRAKASSTAEAPAPARKRAKASSTAEAPAPARKRAETPSRGDSAGATAKRTEQRPKTARKDQPLARYDALTAAEVVGRLRSLSQSELTKVERYERRGEGRQTILKRVAALREKEPWRGYDSANVKEVREKLGKANADRATAVRDYERRHRNRAGVMDAARRRLEDL